MNGTTAISPTIVSGSRMADVVDKDLGWKKLKAAYADLSRKGIDIKVGVLGAQASVDRDGITNAQLMFVHEFGRKDGSIPERAPIRKTMIENAQRYDKTIDKILRTTIDTQKVNLGAFRAFGIGVRNDIVRKIESGLEPPLAESTIARKRAKGSETPETPLIDTRELVDAITSEVKRG